MDYKTKIKKLNKEIEKIYAEGREKVNQLIEERDELVQKHNQLFINSYLKVESEGKEYIFIITKAYTDNFTGEIFDYCGKLLGITTSYYCSDFYLSPTKYHCKSISKEEFNELKEQGIKLIMEDVK